MDLEGDLKKLRERIDDLERIVNTLAGHVHALQPELVSLRVEAARRFDTTDSMLSRIVNRIDTVNTQVWSLRDDLPSILQGRIPGSTSDNSTS